MGLLPWHESLLLPTRRCDFLGKIQCSAFTLPVCDSLLPGRSPVNGDLAQECKVKWVLALTLKKHASLSASSKKDYLTFTVLLVSGLRKRSPTCRDPLLGLETGPVNGTCQLTLAAIFSRHGAKEMLMKSCLAAGTHLNRIKVICEMFCSYTVFSAYINLLPAWKKIKRQQSGVIHSFNHSLKHSRAFVMVQTVYPNRKD